MRERGSTETCSSTPNTIRHMLCVVMIIHTAVPPPMTRRYGPGCAAELRPTRPLHRVVHEIANHPPHLKFYQSSHPYIHDTSPTSFHKTPETKTHMALPKYPTEQFPTPNFLIRGAGSIVFTSTRALLQVYLLHHNIRVEWPIPKWRKDRGEDATTTAVRETGYS